MQDKISRYSVSPIMTSIDLLMLPKLWSPMSKWSAAQAGQSTKWELCSFSCLFLTGLWQWVHALHTNTGQCPVPIWRVERGCKTQWGGGTFLGFSVSDISPLRVEWTDRLIRWRKQRFWLPCWSWGGPGPFTGYLYSQILSTPRRRTLTWPRWVLQSSVIFPLLCILL